MNRFIQIPFLLVLLLVHFQSTANATIEWQSIDNIITDNQTTDLRVNAGAFIVEHDGIFLISTGLAQPKAVKITQQPDLSTSAQVPPTIVTFNPATNTVASQQNITEILPYSAAVSHQLGIFVIGGKTGLKSSNSVGLLRWDDDKAQLDYLPFPPLPKASASPSAVIVQDQLFVITDGETANNFYRMDLKHIQLDGLHSKEPAWQTLPSLPNQGLNAINGIKLVVQNDGKGQKIYAMGGYSITNKSTAIDPATATITNRQPDINQQSNFLKPQQDIWRFDPKDNGAEIGWQYNGKIKLNGELVTSGLDNLLPLGQSHILAFMDNKQALSYNVITQSWARYHQNVKTTGTNIESPLPAVSILSATWWKNQIYSLVSPDNNTSAMNPLWTISIVPKALHFGWQNMAVLVIYLLFVVMVGLFFMFKNRNTDDYFRGGQSIPWWAAACSIYATMLSSLTYVALPAIVYQTDWLLLIGIWMIILVAPVAVYVAMPFFRQIDATSAYEYLSKRFNMGVRLFASGLFTLFHIGRMGIVMALTALALAAVTPLTAGESVLLMGVLCLIYCTLGGIEAVIWTDTLQTVVLIVGAVICFITIISGIDGGMSELISIGLTDNKFTMVNNDFSLNSISTLSIWVIVLGGIGQNISSYTADQAVVQRYMVTSDPVAASKSIWANAIIAGPSALLFFCIGTGLYAFYQLHPEKLDPMIQIDQIFPTFIATELPVGLAGLIVAGIFAAAQSTVSTSMNSIATTLVTDFIRPFNLITTEQGYMTSARWLTFIMGALGTLTGLIFIDPEIRSLMEAYFKIIGMFMGALGGLFVLGVLTTKANATGAIIGILSGVATMVWAWQSGWANGYLYATIGIISCLVIGYISSLIFPKEQRDLDGLTLYSMRKSTNAL